MPHPPRSVPGGDRLLSCPGRGSAERSSLTARGESSLTANAAAQTGCLWGLGRFAEDGKMHRGMLSQKPVGRGSRKPNPLLYIEGGQCLLRPWLGGLAGGREGCYGRSRRTGRALPIPAGGGKPTGNTLAVGQRPRGCERLCRGDTVVSCGCDWCFAVGCSNTRLWFHAFHLICVPRDSTRLFLLVGFRSRPSWSSGNASYKQLFAVRRWIRPTLLSVFLCDLCRLHLITTLCWGAATSWLWGCCSPDS